MAQLEISGVRYQVPETFTYAELAIMQRLTGKTIDQSSMTDVNMAIALAVIVLKRAGIDANEEKLYALDAGAITAVADEEEEQLPPVDAAPDAAAEPATEHDQIQPVLREVHGAQAS